MSVSPEGHPYSPPQRPDAEIAGAASSDALGDRLMAVFWRKPAETLAERARRRVTVHLMPVLFVLYVLAYLDRANVAAAELKMQLPPDENGLGFTQQMVGFGAGIFFYGYWILEIPSTLSVERWGARWVFCRILVLWGLCAMLVGFIGLPIATQAFGWLPKLAVSEASWFHRAAAFVNDLPESAENQFYFFRFMLGFFEGGFFPSVIVYLTYWFRAADRARAIAGFTVASPLSMAIGLPASALLLPVNWFGLPGWRWIFILEGFLPVLAGVAVLFCLPNRPTAAKWMPADELDWLKGELEVERELKRAQGHGFKTVLPMLGVVALLTVVYFCLNVGVYGLVMFMPAIIKSQLRGISAEAATLLASVPFFLAVIGMSLNSWHSDRRRERIWHTAAPLTVVSCGVLLAALCDGVPYLPAAIMMVVVGFCLFAHMPPFWPIPSMFLGATAAASAIGFINMLGNLGGQLGPVLIGKIDSNPAAVAVDVEQPQGGVAKKSSPPTPAVASSTETPSFRAGLLWLAPWPFTAAAIIVLLGFCRGAMGGGVPPAPASAAALDST